MCCVNNQFEQFCALKLKFILHIDVGTRGKGGGYSPSLPQISGIVTGNSENLANKRGASHSQIFELKLTAAVLSEIKEADGEIHKCTQ